MVDRKSVEYYDGWDFGERYADVVLEAFYQTMKSKPSENFRKGFEEAFKNSIEVY